VPNGTVTGAIAFGSSPRKNQVMEENRMKSEWRADPLVWGHGPAVFEVFLEPTCPFSVKAFGKRDNLLSEAGEDRITVKLRLHSQPWHMYSGVIVGWPPRPSKAARQQRNLSWRR
jgi:hypothetical protein